jgi:hypothetical protein
MHLVTNYASKFPVETNAGISVGVAAEAPTTFV